MTWLREALVKVAAAIFPWTPKHERRAAIAAATAEREQSRAGKEHARSVEEQIRRLAVANHFAATITDDIIRGHRHGRSNGG